jgi:hypothetical protein
VFDIAFAIIFVVWFIVFAAAVLVVDGRFIIRRRKKETVRWH